ncbi:MAG: ABC transporter permease [Elusimicrobiota bacterium]|jgi:putative ABC transport system permease protein|nr:ABC transporter permease [Elusimicrobiota bacterium]
MIDILTIFKIAIKAIWINKMRSILTSLGIIIGVGAVIVMLAVGEGTKSKIEQQMASMGSNLLMIQSGSTTSSGARAGFGAQPTLTLDDAYAIEKNSAHVSQVAPSVNGTGQIVYGNQNWATRVEGTTEGLFHIRSWSVEEGSIFTDEEVRQGASVAILGRTVASNLFGVMDPVGKTVRINNIPFRVSGILKSMGQSAMGQDQDDTVIVPVTTAMKKLFGSQFRGTVRNIMVQAYSTDDLEKAEEEIAILLRQRHKITGKKQDDFIIRNLTQMMESAMEASQTFSLLLAAIASISLLVGGIGIMNIMLVSVTERTREIGIRMAIGAKAWDIRLQFLVEALVLSLTGGIIGIVCGIGVAMLIRNFITDFLPIVITLSPMIIAFIFSGLVGIFFGFYPAYKASMLNPIDALRFE